VKFRVRGRLTFEVRALATLLLKVRVHSPHTQKLMNERWKITTSSWFEPDWDRAGGIELIGCGSLQIGTSRNGMEPTVSVSTMWNRQRLQAKYSVRIVEDNFRAVTEAELGENASPSIQTRMSRIRIVHSTAYRYAEPVAFGLHRLVVRPREGHDIQVENLTLRISPACAVSWHRDIFGNSVALASFSESSDFLEFVSDATVFRRDHTSHRRLLDIFPVRLPVEYPDLEGPIARGYLESAYPEETVRLHDWAITTFSPRQGDDAVLLVREINRWIYRSIRYRRREDRGVQTPLETLNLQSGSCRDMATLLLEIARALKLASRFASGYLDSEASLAGCAATHAWTEIYFPEHGWFGCDPTLGEETSQKHIVSGVSSHPRGVMPISGAYSGPTSSFLGMTVSVKIAPFDSSEAA
jgi:transglutaminase-like putative cysteine protease